MRKIAVSSKLWFILILILAAFLRIWQIDKLPAGFNADEINQGYSAYSLLKTGRDEWGEFLPLAPRSFGDYRSPLYTYLTIPSLVFFGLNKFAVRLPSAFLGTLSVLFTMLLVKELFKKSLITNNYSLITGFLLAINPWHLSLSRGAFEANLATFFLPFGFYLFLRGLKDERFLIASSFVFGLDLFSYYSSRFLIPIFVAFLILWFKKYFNLRRVLRFLFVFGFFFLLAFWAFAVGGKTRIFDIGIFNLGFRAPKLFLDNYLSYFSPEFFFTTGAGEATYGMIPGIGVLYLFELPLLLIAFIGLVKKWDKNFLPILIWVVLAPIPASLSLGVGYHANRVVLMIPAIQILSAYGLVFLLGLKLKFKKIVLAFLIVWIFLSTSSFLWNYFRQSPKVVASSMSYGWDEVMNYLTKVEANYQRIIISDEFSEPQIFVAFYKKWNPAVFQQESQDWLRYQEEGLKFVDQLGKYSLDKYEFRDINWAEDRNLKKVIFVGKRNDFPENELLIKKIIPYPDGQPAFLIIERP